MSGVNARLLVLVGLTAVVGGLVVADRMGAFAGDDAEADGPRAAYLAAAERDAERSALLDDAGMWTTGRARAEAAWSSVRERLIRDTSPQLAEQRLRERIVQQMAREGIVRSRTSSATPSVREDDGPIRVVAQRVEFDTVDPRVVYRLIDRMENMPDMMTNIASVSIDGPGPMQSATSGAGRLTVSLTIEALAYVAQEGG